ncbi:hypothetical protein Leryth_017664 [Lithospermum erythrorhizon]|nr:hypothetical protein Leryth_017664 [Lithospermum erythrorhizon]
MSTFSGLGKDYGSLNIEDLLKNIWTLEENQAFATSAGAGNGIAPSGNLQRQGSLTLPRTLSQKTVDDVWRDITAGSNDGDTAELGGSSLGPRQNTLGEMTLEEFLLRAGPYGNSSGLSTRFQPGLDQNVLGKQFLKNGNPVPNSSNNIILNLGGTEISRQEQHNEVESQHQSLFSNEVSMPFSSGVPVLNNNYQISSPQTKVPGIVMSNSNNYQITSHQTKVPGIAMSNSSLNSTLVQHSVILDGASGLASLCNLPASGVAISPENHISSTVIAKRKLDIPPMVPLYTVGEGVRGRRSNSSLE